MNWLGRGNQFTMVFQQYGRLSFNANQTIYSLKQSKFGLFNDVKVVRTLEPVIIATESVDYHYNLTSLENVFMYSPNFRTRFFIGGGYLKETYQSANDGPYPRAQLNKGLFKIGFEGNYRTYHFEELEGHYHRVFYEKVQTGGYSEIFQKCEFENKGFLMLGRSNFAIRNLLGISNAGDTPFAPFILDNFTNVRGVGFKVARSKGHWTINYEYRYTFYRNRNCGNIWCNSLQAVTFCDQSYWLFHGNSHSSMFNKENTKLFGGIGIRWTFHRFNGAALRFDYSWDLMGPEAKGIPLFGIRQYF